MLLMIANLMLVRGGVDDISWYLQHDGIEIMHLGSCSHVTFVL